MSTRLKQSSLQVGRNLEIAEKRSNVISCFLFFPNVPAQHGIRTGFNQHVSTDRVQSKFCRKYGPEPGLAGPGRAEPIRHVRRIRTVDRLAR